MKKFLMIPKGNMEVSKATFRFFAFLLLFCVVAVSAEAQNKNYYSSVLPNGEGSSYFIYSQKGFKNESSKNDLTFEILYLTTDNFATVTLTFKESFVRELNKLSCLTPDGNIMNTYPVEKVKITNLKSEWEYKYQMKVPYKDLHYFCSLSQAPQFLIDCEGDIQMRFNIKENNWKKMSANYLSILDVIDINK